MPQPFLTQAPTPCSAKVAKRVVLELLGAGRSLLDPARGLQLGSAALQVGVGSWTATFGEEAVQHGAP